MRPEDFVRRFGKLAVRSSLRTAIFPSVKLAQAALETGWATDALSPHGNFFGIKAHNFPGPTIRAGTREFINGRWVYIQSDFRKYANAVQSFKDHTAFLYQNSRYQRAGVFDAETPEAQARALQAAGYATAPNYANALIAIIEQNNLKRLDKMKQLHENLDEIAAVAIAVVAIIVLIKAFSR